MAEAWLTICFWKLQIIFMARKCQAWFNVISIYFGYLTVPDSAQLSFATFGKVALTVSWSLKGSLFQLVIQCL